MSTLQWIFLGIIFIYSAPMWRLRYIFRSMVYNEKSWKINFRPWFIKETVCLFSNKYFNTPQKKQFAQRYRFYLTIYGMLWIIFFSL